MPSVATISAYSTLTRQPSNTLAVLVDRDRLRHDNASLAVEHDRIREYGKRHNMARIEVTEQTCRRHPVLWDTYYLRAA